MKLQALLRNIELLKQNKSRWRHLRWLFYLVNALSILFAFGLIGYYFYYLPNSRIGILAPKYMAWAIKGGVLPLLSLQVSILLQYGWSNYLKLKI